MILEKVMVISEVKMSKVSNAPYVLELAGAYPSFMTLNDEALSDFEIEVGPELPGSPILIRLESKPYKQDALGRDSLIIGNIERLTTISRTYSKRVSKTSKTSYYVHLQSPRNPEMELHGVYPCPFYDLKLELTRAEYRELSRLPAKTVFELSCSLAIGGFA